MVRALLLHRVLRGQSQVLVLLLAQMPRGLATQEHSLSGRGHSCHYLRYQGDWIAEVPSQLHSPHLENQLAPEPLCECKRQRR